MVECQTNQEVKIAKENFESITTKENNLIIAMEESNKNIQMKENNGNITKENNKNIEIEESSENIAMEEINENIPMVEKNESENNESEDEEEEELFVKKKKKKDRSYIEKDDEDSVSFNTIKQSNEKSSLDSEDEKEEDSGIVDRDSNSNDSTNLDSVKNETEKLNISSSKKRFCFDDDSDESDDDNINEEENSSKEEGIVEEPGKRETAGKKDKRKILEELVERKKYKTRGEKKNEEYEANSTENLFKNSDLFSKDDSSSEEEGDNNTREEQNENNSMDEDESMHRKKMKKPKKEKKEKIKRPSKNSVKEMKSEQQRLKREQIVPIPYHQPDTTMLKSLLTRIPNIGNKKNKTEIEKKEEKLSAPSLSNVYNQRPKLSFEPIEFEDESSNEVEIVQPKIEDKKLNSFLQRFAKHTGLKKEIEKSNDSKSIQEVVAASQTPGGSHEILKSQLKKRINDERIRNCIDNEKQMKFYNTEGYSDEDIDGEDEENMDDKNSSASENQDEIATQKNKDENMSGSEEDEELSKWNAEDERKQLEVSMEEEEAEEEKNSEIQEKDGSTADLYSNHSMSANDGFPATNTVAVNNHQQDTQCSNSSSVLPAGQGNAFNFSNAVGLTPFTKLLKSGLLDSTSKSCTDQASKDRFAVPCENTQDLYKNDPVSTYDAEDSQSMPAASFHFTLDEESQFDQILDSQGNFQDNKKPRNAVAKSLFGEFKTENKKEESQVSMTQLLGFCSGSFSDDKNSNSKDIKTDNAQEFTDAKEPSQGNMTQLLGLCSGNFSGKEESGNKSSEVTNSIKEENTDSTEQSQGSMTQLLGLCSGNFSTDKNTEDNENETPNIIKEEKKSSTLQDIVEESSELENAMAFCSGNFSDFKTQNGENHTPIISHDENATHVTVSQEAAPQEIDFKKVVSKSHNLFEEVTGISRKNDENKTDVNNKDQINELCVNGKVNENEDFIDSNNLDTKEAACDNENEVSENENEDSDGEEDEVIDGEENSRSSFVDDNNTRDSTSVPEELKEWTQFLTGNKKTKKLNKRAFYEVEAELSGSDDNSDDEVLGSDNDEYELDSDVEDGLPEGEKLRRQVHKIHQQKMLDQEKREVRILQELYIEDGELGSGEARKRNFKWRNIDSDSMNVDDKRLSDGEEEEMTTANIEARMARIEKEKFLQESQNFDTVTMLDETSQCILNKIKTNATLAASEVTIPVKQRTRSLSNKRSGSFLSKVSSLSAANSGIKQSTSQRSGKSFVFQAADAKKTPTSKENKKSADQSMSCQPVRKRQKVERKTSLPNSSSIFSLL